MRKPPPVSRRRLSSFLLIVDSGQLALVLIDHGIGQPCVRIDRFRDACRDVTFALVEKSCAAQAVLQRNRRIVGARPAMGALDPGFAWQAIVARLAFRLLRRFGIVAPSKGRRRNYRRLLFVNDRIVARLDHRWRCGDTIFLDNLRFVRPITMPGIVTATPNRRKGNPAQGDQRKRSAADLEQFIRAI